MLFTDATLIEALNEGEDIPATVNDPITGEPAFTISWVSTGGYRGHYDSTPINGGWEKVDEGAMCGEWDDVPAGTRTSDVEARLNAMAEAADIFVIALPTSNVFSMAFDAYRKVGV